MSWHSKTGDNGPEFARRAWLRRDYDKEHARQSLLYLRVNIAPPPMFAAFLFYWIRLYLNVDIMGYSTAKLQ